MEPPDVLVGILLAHPDDRGEARVLLQHFGLTARDVLPEDYPRLTAVDLERVTAGIGPEDDPQLAPEVLSALEIARSLGRGRVSLRHLLGALLQVPQPLRWMSALAARGDEWSRVSDSYRRWLDEDLPRDVVAGDDLARWLARENPRTPVDLPVYAPDEVNAERDLIGVEAEADAFAYLIASCDLLPPLAVGLFGDWGSGKSFLMNAIERRLTSLTKQVTGEDQADVRVWKHIVRIQFNAWEYVQDNLWAGLLERIFGELGTLRPQLVQTWRAPVESELATVQRTVIDASNRQRTTEQTREALLQQVKDASTALENAQAEAESRGGEKRAQKAQAVARKALKDIWGALPVLLLERRGADLVGALRGAKAELARGHAVLGSYWRRPLHVLLVSLAALLVPLVSLLLARANTPAVVSVLGGLAAGVPVLTTTLGAATRWGRTWLTGLEKAEAEVDAELQAPVKEAKTKLNAAQDKLDEAEEELARARQEAEEARGRQRELESRLNRLTPGRVLVDFADQRRTEYGERLGLLAAVRRDLGDLEAAISANNDSLRARVRSAGLAYQPSPDDVYLPVFEGNTGSLEDGGRSADVDRASSTGEGAGQPEVPNRIVLYIDDLDRCSPAKVMEVLEAVHLLLSFRMFVVVVAVDSRWLTSALTDQLVALRSTATANHATPQDYLEKIFQLPFWVQPLPAQGRARLVHGLLSDSVRPLGDTVLSGRPDRALDGLHVGPRERELADSMLARHGAEVRLDTSPLVLAREDLDFFESVAPLLGDTPRRVKRFVNTCQFLFALAPPLRPGGSFPSPRAVVSLVAAIGEGLPFVAELLFAELDAISTSSSATPDLAARGRTCLEAFLASATVVGAQRGSYDQERAVVVNWLAQQPAWRQVPLQDLTLRLDMIRRLRFEQPNSRPAARAVS